MFFLSKINKHTCLTHLCVLAFYFYFLSMIMGKDVFSTLLGSLCAIPYFAYRVLSQKVNREIIILSITMIAGSLLNLLISTNGIGGTIVLLGVFSLALSILENSAIYVKHAKVVYLVFTFFFYYQILIQQVDINDFYPEMSRNYLGLILVYLSGFYLFIKYIDTRKPSLFVAINSVILSILFIGRSSIGAMLFMLLVTMCIYIRRAKIIMKLVIITIILIAIYYMTHQIMQLYSLSSFSKHGLDTPRYELWLAFFRSMDMYTFIAGIDTNTIPEVSYYQGNIHNGYLNILARTGLGFVYFLLILIYSISKYIYNQQWYLFLLMCTLSFRVFFDTGVFISEVGFIYYAILLYPFFPKEQRLYHKRIIQ